MDSKQRDPGDIQGGQRYLRGIGIPVQAPLVVFLQARLCIIDALAVEAHPVNDSVLQRQPEHPWRVVAWLWLGR